MLVASPIYFMGDTDTITKKLKKIVSQISGKPEPDKPLEPEYNIKGKGYLYCMSVDNRTLIKINRGQVVYIVQHKYDIIGRTLIYTYFGEIALIDPEELEKIGFE